MYLTNKVCGFDVVSTGLENGFKKLRKSPKFWFVLFKFYTDHIKYHILIVI